MPAGEYITGETVYYLHGRRITKYRILRNETDKMSKRDILKILIIAAVLVLAVVLLGRIEHTQDTEESQIVHDAIKNAALTCYAVEGAYPEDVEYLREHYQLAYDEERYLVTYIPFAPNVLPTIYITERGATLH